MGLKPFFQLESPRAVNRLELPSDLAEFYAHNEGAGLESELPNLEVLFCRLDEVTEVSWKDLRPVDDVPEGWERFAAFHIGIGSFFTEIAYVLEAPACPAGSILAIGTCIPGPGGAGRYSLETTLVLAVSFHDWLAHLERWGWVEYALVGCGDLPEQQRQELCRYYLALNPSMNVG